eukprot:135633-Amphidinium_carterae.6
MLTEPRQRGEVPPDSSQQESNMSGARTSPVPLVSGETSLRQSSGHAASAAAGSANVASATRQERGDSGDVSSSSHRLHLQSDSDVTPYNRWNSISNTSTSAAPSSKGGLQPAELERFLIRSGVKRKRGYVPRRDLVTSSTSGLNSTSSCAPSAVRNDPPVGMVCDDDPISECSSHAELTCATTTRWSHSDDDDDDDDDDAPIEPF